MSAGTPTIPQGILPSQDQSEPYLNRLSKLSKYQFDYLIEAIRRDMRIEDDKINSDPHFSFFHRVNAGVAKEVLETLNPYPNYRGVSQCPIKKP